MTRHAGEHQKWYTAKDERFYQEVLAKIHMHEIVNECHAQALRLNRIAA